MDMICLYVLDYRYRCKCIGGLLSLHVLLSVLGGPLILSKCKIPQNRES